MCFDKTIYYGRYVDLVPSLNVLECVALSSLWSNASYWLNSSENNFTVPEEGADVVIPSGNFWTTFKTKYSFLFLLATTLYLYVVPVASQAHGLL